MRAVAKRLQSAHRNRAASCLVWDMCGGTHSADAQALPGWHPGLCSKMWQGGIWGYFVVSIKFIPQNAFLNDFIRAEWATTPQGRSWAVETHRLCIAQRGLICNMNSFKGPINRNCPKIAKTLLRSPLVFWLILKEYDRLYWGLHHKKPLLSFTRTTCVWRTVED